MSAVRHRKVARTPLGERGFSVIEIFVVVSIAIIVMSVILVGSGRHKSALLTTNLAYDIALSFREVQQYGVAVREASAGSQQFSFAYGMSFDATALTQYQMFIDRDNDKVYDASPAPPDVNAELLRTVSISSGFRIDRFCATRSGGIQDCSNLSGGNALPSLNITFKRPEPDGVIQGPTHAYSEATIYVISASGADTAQVRVANTGQISVTE